MIAKGAGCSKRVHVSIAAVKFEILNPCPVESHLKWVRVAEFHRASTKQTRNSNSPMFKTIWTKLMIYVFWSFGF